MKKSVQILILLIIPALLLSFIGVVVAASPPLPGQGQPEPRHLTGPPPPFTWLEATQDLGGLVIASTAGPSSLNTLTYFTATLQANYPLTQTIESYVWLFGDGGAAEGPNTTAYVYITKGLYEVTVLGLNNEREPIASGSLTIIIGIPPEMYLPIISLNSDLTPPDLLCKAITATPARPVSGQTILLTIDIENKTGSSADGFWVDLYINPSRPPGANTRWGTVCDAPGCPGGIAWSIANSPLAGGETRTLRSVSNVDDPDGYDPANTSWVGNQTLSQPRTYTIYAYVDSWHPSQPFGAIRETDETNNLCPPITLTVAPARTNLPLETQPGLLPERPGP